MNQGRWMIYGAYGFTGRLIVEEALRRGHRPILAGRSAEALTHLAGETGLDSLRIALDDHRALVDVLDGVDLVLNAAGPFVETAGPMTSAAIEAGTNYADITGEIPALRATLDRHEEAVARRIALVPGVGFDVVPSDCLAAHVARRLPDACRLEIVIEAEGRPTSGTIHSTLGMAALGGFVLRNGELVARRLGDGVGKGTFFGNATTLLPAPIGDLVTASRSTGIGDITTYLSLGGIPPLVVRSALGLIRPLLRSPRGRNVLLAIAGRFVMKEGKDATVGSARIQITAENERGDRIEGRMRTPAGYHLTAQTTVRGVELILEQRPIGALTPSQAFGPDFILEFDGIERSDDSE